MKPSRARFGVLLALLAVAILAALLLLRRSATAPPVPVPRAPASAPGPGRAALAPPSPAPDVEPPGPGDLVVNWCPEVDAPRELFVSLGYLDTQHTDPVAQPDPCSTPGPRPGSCRYEGLRHGRYLALQPPFAVSGFLDGEGATTLDLGCVASCGARVVVHPLDGCASQGSFELLAGWEGASGTVLANVTWQADEPFSLRDLACLPQAGVRIRAEGCEPLNDRVSLQEAQANYSFELRSAGRLMVQVVDGETEEPIAGALLIVARRPLLPPSDAEGWVGPFTLDESDPLPFLHKAGYARRDLAPWTFKDSDVFVAPLFRTRPLAVRCEDNGSPCPHDTRMFVDQFGWKASGRRCVRTDDWTWSCEVVEGDRARACVEQRCSDREKLLMDGGDTVYLPPFDGAICLTWPPETSGPCTLSFGEVSDARRQPCDTCGEAPVTSGAAVPVPLNPGQTAQVTLACADGAWSGEAAVDGPSSVRCEAVVPRDLGVVCAQDFGSCRAYSQRAEIRLSPHFNGCSEPIPAGPWSVNCGGLWYEVDLPAGETVDVTGPGETPEEHLQKSREELE